MTDFKSFMQPLYIGEKLTDRLAVFPERSEVTSLLPPEQRLAALTDIYNVYIPSHMSVEIYNKLYIAQMRSLQKKFNLRAVKQAYNNHAFCSGVYSGGVIGGADCFSIVGISGIGKTLAICRAVDVISGGKLIVLEDPHVVIIPCLNVQCPFDCSPKSLMIEILRKIDETLGTNVYSNRFARYSNTDMLIGAISQMCLTHVGVLIIDEIQNVVKNKNGAGLIAALTQLINNSGVSICMVGTPECEEFFEKTDYLARRTIGLRYSILPYDEFFQYFCRTLLSYSYTAEECSITERHILWLYQHSGGVISNVIALIHDAQEIAIINGIDKLNIKMLKIAYDQRMAMLHPYIDPNITRSPQTTGSKAKLSNGSEELLKQSEKPKESKETDTPVIANNISLSELVKLAKKQKIDCIELLKKCITVEEIKL